MILKKVNIHSKVVAQETNVTYDGRKSLTNPAVVAETYKDFMTERGIDGKERFDIFILDTKLKMAGIHEVSTGTVNKTLVHPREVFRAAIKLNAKAIICVHNHPSGDTRPSTEDIQITNRLVEAGNILGIEVADHIIVGDYNDEFFSMKEKNIIQ